MKKLTLITCALLIAMLAKGSFADEQKPIVLSGTWGDATFNIYAAQTGGAPVTALSLVGKKFTGAQQTYVAGAGWLDVQMGGDPAQAWKVRVFASAGAASQLLSALDPTKGIDATYRFTGTDTTILADGTALIPDIEWPYPTDPGNLYSWFIAIDDPAITDLWPAPLMSSAETYTGRQRVIFGVRIADTLTQGGAYSATMNFVLDIE